MITKKQTIEFNTLEPYLRGLAFSFTRNNVDAEDLYQETIERAIRKIHLFQEGTSLKNWSSTIMRNIFINDYRKKKKMQTSYVEPGSYIHHTLAVSNKAEAHLELEEVNKEIAKLPNDYQTIIDFVKYGYQYKEIADKLQLPLGTIKSRIHFARKKLNSRISRA